MLFIFVLISANSAFAGKSWKYYYNNGLNEYKFGNYFEAEYFFLRALKKNIKLYEACNKLAEIYLKKNKHSESIKFYRKSLEINNVQPRIHCALGELYEFFLEFDKSLIHYNKAVEYEANYMQANYNLVRYYVRNNDRSNADKYIDICNKLGGSKANELYKQGLEQSEKKKLTEALNFYQKAVDKNPVMMKAVFAISEIYRQKKDYENAALYMEKIKEINPEYKNINIHLGYLYFNASLKHTGTSKEIQKRKILLKRAVKNIKLAINNKPDDSELYILLSQSYRHLGEDEKSFNAMRKAAEIEDAK